METRIEEIILTGSIEVATIVMQTLVKVKVRLIKIYKGKATEMAITTPTNIGITLEGANTIATPIGVATMGTAIVTHLTIRSHSHPIALRLPKDNLLEEVEAAMAEEVVVVDEEATEAAEVEAVEVPEALAKSFIIK